VFDTDEYWVQAAPFRALVARFLDLTDLPWPLIARHAGVPPAVVHRLLYGRGGRTPGRIPIDCARRLLAVDEARLVQLARARYH